MRLIPGILLLIIAAAFAGRTAEAAAVPHETPSPAIARQSEEAAPGGNDDTVAVQLTVLGIVLGTVFVAGTGAFLLRRKLGLTAYTAPKDTGHH